MKEHRGGLLLALGIIGVTVCQLAAPIAWIMGNADLKEMRAGRMDRSGEGLVNAGRILGIIGSVMLGLSCCGVGLYILVVVFAIAGSAGAGAAGGF